MYTIALDHFLTHKHLIYPFWSIYKVHFPVLKVHAGMSVPAELVRKGVGLAGQVWDL
jgi:hypothetical protein